jgi:hypothetical protein
MASSARDAPDLDAEAEVDLGRYSGALLALRLRFGLPSAPSSVT